MIIIFYGGNTGQRCCRSELEKVQISKLTKFRERHLDRKNMVAGKEVWI